MGMKSLTLAVAMAAFAFTGMAHAEDKGLVAVAMPTKSSARWIADGDNMVKVLKERGYQTDLQYAEDDVPNQLAQIENMVTKGPRFWSLHRSMARRFRVFWPRHMMRASRSSLMTA
ncbi:multiple sugar-binding periplasmic receptor ChvE [Brucella melitensis F1/06 B10]|nr:sugar-binding periplasmic receptor ChvE [Brucella melitensis]ENS55985.1 multiple sugar-binding periplasmic receptor ChvE [Brucella melitensis F1/06 B10]